MNWARFVLAVLAITDTELRGATTGAVADQQLIELGQQRLAPDKLLVALSLVRLVEPFPEHPRLTAS